jgi:hypothetical protein
MEGCKPDQTLSSPRKPSTHRAVNQRRRCKPHQASTRILVSRWSAAVSRECSMKVPTTACSLPHRRRLASTSPSIASQSLRRRTSRAPARRQCALDLGSRCCCLRARLAGQERAELVMAAEDRPMRRAGSADRRTPGADLHASGSGRRRLLAHLLTSGDEPFQRYFLSAPRTTIMRWGDELDPVWWTPIERRIRCRPWTRGRGRSERGGASPTSSRWERSTSIHSRAPSDPATPGSWNRASHAGQSIAHAAARTPRQIGRTNARMIGHLDPSRKVAYAA